MKNSVILSTKRMLLVREIFPDYKNLRKMFYMGLVKRWCRLLLMHTLLRCSKKISGSKLCNFYLKCQVILNAVSARKVNLLYATEEVC